MLAGSTTGEPRQGPELWEVLGGLCAAAAPVQDPSLLPRALGAAALAVARWQARWDERVRSCCFSSVASGPCIHYPWRKAEPGAGCASCLDQPSGRTAYTAVAPGLEHGAPLVAAAIKSQPFSPSDLPRVRRPPLCREGDAEQQAQQVQEAQRAVITSALKALAAGTSAAASLPALHRALAASAEWPAAAVAASFNALLAAGLLEDAVTQLGALACGGLAPQGAAAGRDKEAQQQLARQLGPALLELDQQGTARLHEVCAGQGVGRAGGVQAAAGAVQGAACTHCWQGTCRHRTHEPALPCRRCARCGTLRAARRPAC